MKGIFARANHSDGNHSWAPRVQVSRNIQFRAKQELPTSRRSSSAVDPNRSYSTVVDGHGTRTASPEPSPEPGRGPITLADRTSSAQSTIIPPSVQARPSTEESPPIANNVQPMLSLRVYHSARRILLSRWLNILLLFVPAGFAVNFAHSGPVTVFVVNAFAIVPLAGLLTFATESIAKRSSDVVGGLLNVTFGNAVELIIL
ncbi:MAG: hypothetical protein M1829_001026 [Trizodia sp. TS-e1964]|nr:MAG: hypothetical protein M1829_001026 [Trizodia sp. TS-e1964]